MTDQSEKVENNADPQQVGTQETEMAAEEPVEVEQEVFEAVDQKLLDFIANLDSFKMFSSHLERMSQFFQLKHFVDCEEVTVPQTKDLIYILLRGRVAIISEDRVYTEVKREIKRSRWKRKKDREKRAAEGKENEPVIEDPIPTDFPFNNEKVNKADFKVLDQLGTTFGNDKLISGKNFRPSFARAIGNYHDVEDDTRVHHITVLAMPTKVIEETLKKLSNTGENKEKTDFFSHFKWFDNFTQSLKTKFNNCMHKKDFYPGAKIIQEGKNIGVAYVIISGTVKLVCQKSNSKFRVLEYQSDPTKARRDLESVRAQSGGNDKQLSLGTLVQNGYVSKTLRTIQIGIKSQHEWLGEDLLLMETPVATYPNQKVDTYDYTAIAVNKVTVYMINYADMFKIPQHSRDQMCHIVQMRQELIVKRTLDLYKNLKNIKKKVEYGESDEEGDNEGQSRRNNKSVLQMGQKLQKMIEKDSVFKVGPDEKTIKKNKLAQFNVFQNHMTVLQRDGMQTTTLNPAVGDPITSVEQITLPYIHPNPKDAMMLQSSFSVNDGLTMRGLKNVRSVKETISLNSLDIRNYGLKKSSQQLNQRYGNKSALLPVYDDQQQYLDQDVYISPEKDAPMHVVDQVDLSGRTYQGRNHDLDNQNQMGTQGRVRTDMREKSLNPAMSHKLLNYGTQPYTHEQSTPLLRPALSEHRLQVKGQQSVRSLHHGSQSVGSLASVQPSTISHMKSHNRGIMDKIRERPFESPNLVKEVLNKPNYQKSILAHAQSLKPYLNPNRDYYSAVEQSPGLAHALGRSIPQRNKQKTIKLVPIYKNKEYTKMKELLPSMQARNTSKSLINSQIEAQRQAEQFDREQCIIKEKARADIMNKKNQKKVSVVQQREYDRQLQKLESDFAMIVNPYQMEANRALNLRINDFSYSDMQKAQELMSREQFKIQMKQKQKKLHNEIAMFEPRLGTKSIQESNYVKRQEIDLHMPQKIDASRVIQEKDGATPDKSPANQSSNEKVVLKKICLNQNLKDEDINVMHIDPDLVEKILTQDNQKIKMLDSQTKFRSALKPTVSPVKLVKGSGGTSFVHAFDLLKNTGSSGPHTETRASRQKSEQVPIPPYQELLRANDLDGEPDRLPTPNPFYHQQRRKLILRYQKQLLEEVYEADQKKKEEQSKNKSLSLKRDKVSKKTTVREENAVQQAD